VKWTDIFNFMNVACACLFLCVHECDFVLRNPVGWGGEIGQDPMGQD